MGSSAPSPQGGPVPPLPPCFSEIFTACRSTDSPVLTLLVAGPSALAELGGAECFLFVTTREWRSSFELEPVRLMALIDRPQGLLETLVGCMATGDPTFVGGLEALPDSIGRPATVLFSCCWPSTRPAG